VTFLQLHHFWGQEVGEKGLVCLPSIAASAFASADGKHVDWHARALHAPVVALSAVGDHAEHARRRRTWTRGFSPAALRDYEEMVNERVIQLTETLSARKSVDLARLFGYFA